MSSLIKTQEEILNELHLKVRKLTNKFNNILTELETIIEEIEKVNNNERLKKEKPEGMIRKVSAEYRTKKTEELEWELRFLTIKNRYSRNLSDYEEEKEAKKSTRKVMEEMDKFETKIKNIRELIIDTIKHDYDKSTNDLNVEKGLGIERIKKIETKLQKIKLSKTIADTTKKSVISEKCLHHISRHRRYCA